MRQEFEPDLSDAFVEMREKNVYMTIRGTPGCQLLPELDAADSDRVLVKKRYSAFFGTNLDQVLGELQATSLILAGINTHACVRMTAIDGYQRDWRVVLARECVASYDPRHHEISMQYMAERIATALSNTEIARLCRMRTS